MAFVKARKQASTWEDLKEEVYLRANEYMADEAPLIVPEKSKPWAATAVSAECPRQIYYKRHAKGLGTGQVSMAAVFGTTVHQMFQHGAPDDPGIWEALLENTVQKAGATGLYDDKIKWLSGSKPFDLSGYRDASVPERVDALFLRYMELDRANFLSFWEDRPVAIYRHPETGRLAQEQKLTAEVDGHKVRGMVDAVLTDVYTGELIVVDWKTGRVSHPMQLTTYAMAAEQHFGFEPGSIKTGWYVLTGEGQCLAKRGKLPHGYIPDPDASVVGIPIDAFRDEVQDKLKRLAQREARGKWAPKFNRLCYNTCDFRFVCPVGKAVQEIRREKQDARTS